MSERDIFIAALQRDDPEARRACLDESCGPDAALRARVEELLAVHERAASFLESPPAGPAVTADLPAAEGPGTVIGPYKLLERIGEGGFGVVYMAEQTEPVRRKVALKVLKPGMDSRQVVARFEAERQALALMDHPNIARVFDGGATPSGRPYFVMELVKGTPITDFCDANHLTPRDRLGLFAAVCRAVQHAHQKGIIHRDLKPSNVLVSVHDTTPVVKVIDFGIAKALGQELTDKTLFTGFAQMVGTPLYMSPEQAGHSGLDVDTRSDVYSLGVLLYELLTGTTPFTADRFRKAAYDEIRRIIREEEPPRPSTRLSASKESLPSVAAVRRTEPARLTRLLRGELDWIVMKALEKDRGRRYETASAFSADVERYLSGEPVQAVPPSAAYRLRKFARRNKSALGVAALVLVFLVVLGTGAGWAVRDRAARADEAERERAARRNRLEREVALAIDEVERAYRLDRLPDALSALARAEGLLNTGEAGEEVRGQAARWRAELDVLRKLEEVRLGYGSKGGRRADALAADAALRRAFAGLGVDVDGQAPEESAARIRTRLTRERLAEALDYWGWVRQELTHLKAVPQAARRRMHEVARLADPHPVRDRARLAVERWDHAAAARLAASLGVLDLPPATLRVLAMVLFWGSPEQRATAMRLLADAQARRPGDFWLNYTCANYYQQLSPPRWAEATHYYAVALALRPDNPFLHRQLGVAYLEQGKGAEAEAAFRRAIDLDPGDAPARSNLGVTLTRQKRLDEAAACFRKAVELDPTFAGAHDNLGVVLDELGKVGEAIPCYRRAIELDPNRAATHYRLGAALGRWGRPDEAAACYRKAIELDPKLAAAHRDLGVTLGRQGKWDEAVAAFRRVVELNPSSAADHANLGIALARQGKWDEAVTRLRRAIDLDPADAVAHLWLGRALGATGRGAEAVTAFREAVRLNPSNPDAEHHLAWLLANDAAPRARDLAEAVARAARAVELSPGQATYRNTLGMALYRSGDWAGAARELTRACELRGGGNASDWFFLAMARWRLGEMDDARRWFDRAAEWTDRNAPKSDELARLRAEAVALLGPAPEKLTVPPREVRRP